MHIAINHIVIKQIACEAVYMCLCDQEPHNYLTFSSAHCHYEAVTSKGVDGVIDIRLESDKWRWSTRRTELMNLCMPH